MALAFAVAMLGVISAPIASATPAWEALGSGVDARVRSLLWTTNGVFAGGDFTSAGGAEALHVARWNGSAWSPLGAGTQSVEGHPEAGEVNALIDLGGAVYLGGNFQHVGDPAVSVGFVARWTGTALEPTPVVSYETRGLQGTVYAADHAPEGGVYLAGAFRSLAAWWEVGSFNRIVRFDGTTWSPLATPFGSTDSVSVQGIDVADDGRIAVGTYDGSTGAGHVHVLAGGAWSELGPGFDNIVEEVAFGPDGSLYAGGDFTFLDENPDTTYVRGIARWNPALMTWQPVGGGANGRVHAIAFDPLGRMIIGGDFRYVNNDVGTEYGRIAAWDGTAWSGVGGGVGTWAVDAPLNAVEAIAIDPTGRLYAGGSFAVADGATPVSNIAAIAGAAPAAPTGVSATAGNGRATVSWTGLEGDASVTYRVTASGGAGTCAPTGAATSCTVTGLRNGSGYTFTVAATNEAATGPSSAASNRVTPRPPAPTLGEPKVVGGALVQVVVMRSPGTVTHSARWKRGARWVRFCERTRTVVAAMTVTLRCPLGREIRTALGKGAVRVSTSVTAAPAGGAPREATGSLTIPKRGR